LLITCFVVCLEEELKRLREALVEDSYGEVAFSYDQPIDEANVGGEAVQSKLLELVLICVDV
jgi:hypothetical protein